MKSIRQHGQNTSACSCHWAPTLRASSATRVAAASAAQSRGIWLARQNQQHRCALSGWRATINLWHFTAAKPLAASKEGLLQLPSVPAPCCHLNCSEQTNPSRRSQSRLVLNLKQQGAKNNSTRGHTKQKMRHPASGAEWDAWPSRSLCLPTTTGFPSLKEYILKQALSRRMLHTAHKMELGRHGSSWLH
jgi:hypothetical protein